MGHKAHHSAMMHMRLKAMETTMQWFHKITNDLMEFENNGQMREVDARQTCAELHEFHMFRITPNNLDASEYYPLSGY